MLEKRVYMRYMRSQRKKIMLLQPMASFLDDPQDEIQCPIMARVELPEQLVPN
jgi:hypothetical protein